MIATRRCVYLAGEIHTPWRDEIVAAACARGLEVQLTGPALDHDASDRCGEQILGPQESSFWRDHAGAGINAIRSRVLLGEAEIVLARFSSERQTYPDWTSAYEAGRAVALGKPLITLHDEKFDHQLKEVDRAALSVARNAEQVAAILEYVFDRG
jgi:YtoQ family protein